MTELEKQQQEQMANINAALAVEGISQEDQIKLLNSKVTMIENGTPSGDQAPNMEGKTGAELIRDGLKKYNLGGANNE